MATAGEQAAEDRALAPFPGGSGGNEQHGLWERIEPLLPVAIRYLREQQIILIFDPASGTLRAGTGETDQTITLTAS